MDSRRFDAFARALVTAGSRRGLLGIVTALPVAGGLAALLGEAEVDAQGRRQRRKKRHKHGKGRRRNHHKHKKKCKSRAKICASRCGSVKDKCRKKTIDCACPSGQLCAAGSCICDGDVCVGGCRYTSIQEAIDDPDGPTSIRLCAQTYAGTITIGKNLTLIGAGDGEDGTVLDGQGNGSVVTVIGGVTAALQALRITGGLGNPRGGGILTSGTLTLTDCTVTGNDTIGNGGGIFNDTRATMRMTGCTVSGNSASADGGGILNNISATLEMAGTSVMENHAGAEGGGILNNGGTSTCSGDSSVSGNTAGDPPVTSDCVARGVGSSCGTC